MLVLFIMNERKRKNEREERGRDKSVHVIFAGSLTVAGNGINGEEEMCFGSPAFPQASYR